MKKWGEQLATSISNYGNKYGVDDIKGVISAYPGPVVGLYGSIADNNPPPDGTTREAHHAPPYELAQTLSTALRDAGESLVTDDDLVAADPLEKAADKIDAAGGNELPAILVHSKTHRIRGAGPRIHGSEIRAELTQRLKADGIDPSTAITTTKKKVAVRGEGDTYKRFLSNVGAEKSGDPNMKLQEALKRNGPAVVKEAYRRASKQALHQVEIALESSKFDGTPQEKQAAMTQLRAAAKETWEDHLLSSLF